MNAKPSPHSTPNTRSGGFVLALSTVVAALGSFLFGFDTAVISGTTGALRTVFELSDGMLGFTVSSALIGTMIGALGAAKPADRWGRRPMLVILAAFFLVSAVGCGFAWNWHALICFRFLGGIAVGAASVVSPLYITEIAPAHRRGLLVTISQLNIVVGILAAFLSNYILLAIMGEASLTAWRWMLGVMAVPSLLFLASALLIPESPRWLVKAGRNAEAERVLNRVGHAAAKEKVAEIASSLAADRAKSHQRLFHRAHLKPLLLALMIAAFNQLDGINAVLYYSGDIFKMAGASNTNALMQSVLVGLVNLVMTLVAMTLIDKLGRKPLLLIGSITFIASHLLAAWAFWSHATGWPVLVAMMGVVGSHAYSQGAVVWVIINEVLPNSVRAAGSAAACFLMWSLCAIISWTFPVVAAKSGALVFGFFAAMMALQFVLVWRFLPETKGVSLEAMEAQLGRH
ncbi:MAG: sugar porter family MFS transporter [Verrucomicrobia bacterium]|jgi:sugar porter (SP) family MFS transporter|nr:sugar porter family MFS transporter [Verrucomicrobiota bacterium]